MVQYQNGIVKDCHRPQVTHVLPWSIWSRGNILWLEDVTPKGAHPSWLGCVWKKLMVSFFSSWMSLFKVKITSTPPMGMEEKNTKMNCAKWPDLLGTKIIVYFLRIIQCPQKGKYSNQWICVLPNFLFRERRKYFLSISLLHNEIEANRKENSAYQNSPLGNQWLPFYTLFLISFRVSHLILSFELIKVCLNVTDILKFSVIWQEGFFFLFHCFLFPP